MSTKKRLISAVIAFIIAIVLVFGFDFDPIGYVTSSQQDGASQPYTASATVTRVIDGDTIDVRIAGRPETVRLIGVDAPEIRWPSDKNNLTTPKPEECFALEARAFLRKRLTGDTVRLVGDPIQPVRDEYDRRLAYVYNANQLINKLLLAGGYVRYMSVGDGFARQTSFQKTAAKARAHNRGLWKECPPT